MLILTVIGEKTSIKKKVSYAAKVLMFDCVMYIHTCLCTEDNSSKIKNMYRIHIHIMHIIR